MRAKLTKVMVTAALGMLVITTAAQFAHAGCSNQTLRGQYAFRLSGEIYVPGGNMIANYRDGVAMTYFDGVGGLTQVDWVMANGLPLGGPEDANGFHNQETGWYKVNSNCTGEAEIDFPPHDGTGAVITLKFVVGDNGRTMHTIVTSLKPPDSDQTVPANIHSDAVRVADSRLSPQ